MRLMWFHLMPYTELPAEFRLLSSAPTLAAWQYTARDFKIGMKIEWFEPGETVERGAHAGSAAGLRCAALSCAASTRSTRGTMRQRASSSDSAHVSRR